MTNSLYAKVDALLGKTLNQKNTHTIVLGIQSADGSVQYRGAVGEGAAVDQSYLLASITKLYTAAVIMHLVDQGKLRLDDRIADYLPVSLLEGIHVYEGTDYSRTIKVYQLLHQTSGLPDYFEGKPAGGGSSLSEDLQHNRDRAYTVEDTADIVRGMKPHFVPGAKDESRSHYSDMNYHLLGEIIQQVTGQSLVAVYQAIIFAPLGLTQTYLYDHKLAQQYPAPLPTYYKDSVMHIPLALTSEGAQGGLVATLDDSLAFLQAFFNGRLFNAAHFDRMMARWNGVFFPVQYGYGMMRFKMPRAMTLFQYTPELIGHSGSTGSFAFYAPKEALYVAGSFNQSDAPSRPFRFMMQAISAITS